MTHASQTVHTLAGAYALDALDPAERAEFEAHLGECDTCAEEVRGLRETAARLGTAAARPAPEAMRARVLAEIAQTRQVPPHVTAEAAEERDELAAARGRRARRRRVGTALLGAAAAACVAVAAVSGAAAYRAEQRADRAEAQAARLQADADRVNGVLAAPDARAVTDTVTSGGRGTVVVSRAQGRAVVIMSGLAAAPAARTYELWLMGEGDPRPAGTMATASAPVLVTGVGEATQVGITVEPAGGSPAPTTRPIFAVGLPA
ncbi:anti-sigma factor [Actinomadura parmotrematis]|uniref:Regulator of SigK n=1 Tax=Actinomadura parmotrematis TaxID=2864039 RepID=A0ABS7FNM6_9ACTN|nr:anti-sigma factor [Actinomadura parmotrematis]MBW8481359.1 anti-sigma factor [Actinomadura parmotrematis]